MKIKDVFPALPDQDKKVLKEMGNDLKQVILRPFLILFKIPANFLDVLYQGVCLYSVKIPQCAGRLLMLPVNLLISFCEGLSFGQVRGRIHGWAGDVCQKIRLHARNMGLWFSRRGNTDRKMKLYQKTVSRYCIADDSTARDRIREKCCYVFAFLLQTVSFFTTYAGLELYFGGVFFLAPFLITLVIQGTLYTAVVTVFQSGKKKGPMALCMTVFACASILFSYTGLITLYHSPADDYTLAYETYAKRFEQVRESLLEDYPDTRQASIQIIKAMDTMENNVSMAQKKITLLTGQKDSVEVPPQFTNNRSVSISADGSQTTTTMPVANAGYQEALDRINSMDSAIAELEENCRPVMSFLDLYSGPSIQSLLEQQSSASLSGDRGDDGDHLKAIGRLETAFSQAAAASNQLSLKLGNGSAIDEDLVSQCRKSMDRHQELSSITLTLPAGSTEAAPSQKTWGIMSLILRAGQMIGADFGNANMNDLSRMRDNVIKAVDDNYGEMMAYEGEGAVFEALSLAKEQADSLPGIMVLGWERLLSPQTRSDALLCLCLSLFNDGTSILLGYAGTVRRSQDLLNRRGKRPINGMNDLFILLYYSMHDAFTMQIKGGQFDDMDDERFEGLCRKFVNSASSHINRFIGRFTLSPCTSSEGYNRCFIYRDAQEVKDFMPFISALIQSGLMDIIPLSAYKEIEEKFDLGISWAQQKNLKKKQMSESEAYEPEAHEPKAHEPVENAPAKDLPKGYVLLLRNNSEEYMLKQLGYDFVAGGIYEM